MPLDRNNTNPMYLTGRLAALGDNGDDRLSEAELARALVNPLSALPMLDKRIAAAGRTGLAAEIYELIPASGLPAGPVKVEDQGPYWLGYYHQRSYPRHVAVERDELEQAGTAMFGSRWQTDMADLLGYGDAARLRSILRGDRKMAGGALADLVAELRQRSSQTAAIADRLEHLLADPHQEQTPGGQIGQAIE